MTHTLPLFLALALHGPHALLGSAGEGEQTAAGAASVLVRHSLSGASVAYDSGSYEESLLLHAGSPIAAEQLARARDFQERVDPAMLAELVVALFPQEFEYEGREILLQENGDLVVVAPPEVQEKVAAAVRAIEAALTAAVDLRIDVIELPADAAPPFGGRAVVDAAQVEALRSAPAPGRARESYAVRLQSGRTAIVERSRAVPLVVDYDVEIAQGVAVFDPVAGQAEAGTRFLVRGAPAPGGLALALIFSHGAALEPEPIDVTLELRSRVGFSESGVSQLVDEPGALQRIDLAFRSAAFETFLPDGKALVIESGLLPGAAGPDGAARSRQVVVVQRTGGALAGFHRFRAPGARAELLFVNADAVTPPPLWTSGEPYDDDDSPLARVPSVQATLEVDADLFLADWVAARFANWRTFGPWIACVYDPSWDAEAGAQLEALVASAAAPVELIELDVRARAAGVEVASFRLPVRAGSRAAVMAGVSTTAVVDYQVEVAQFAATADPDVRPRFHGVSVLARAQRAPEGTIVDVDAALRVRRPASTFSIGGPMIGWLDVTGDDAIAIAQRVELASGAQPARAVLGDGGDPASALALEIAAR